VCGVFLINGLGVGKLFNAGVLKIVRRAFCKARFWKYLIQ
jgi:hypothetical protein